MSPLLRAENFPSDWNGIALRALYPRVIDCITAKPQLRGRPRISERSEEVQRMETTQRSTKPAGGFIGMGHMGSHIAEQLFRY